ncbi:isoprenoid synthase domain-containing protein [Mycena albidolilacea]|uniref:Terpene synthase n=1 Tax=Mycena albidolilacea TaxID=1033008 RepID=A0AAD7ATQ4_9AGAR|nr:isoprenoid synthase domain-containing protein [Mycena albidolilacea]
MSIEFRIPDLLETVSTYRKPLNTNFDALDAGFQKWIDDAAFLSTSHKKSWKHAELPLLIARAFPDADAPHLQVSLESMMMFLILEQLTDTPATSIVSKKWAHEFVEALQQAEAPQTKKEGPAAVLQLLGTKVISAIDPPYRPGYIASNVLLAEGVVQEALDREQYDEKNPISLETYLTTRRKSIGILPFHDLARWAWKLDFPDGSHVLENPHIQLMVQASVDLVLLANDIYSYRKEYLEDGAKHNYVTVAMHDPSTPIKAGDIQAAIDYTVTQFAAALARYKENQALLPFGNDADLSAKVERYSELMMDSVAGNIEWSVACKRYSLFPDEAARKAGLVKI